MWRIYRGHPFRCPLTMDHLRLLSSWLKVLLASSSVLHGSGARGSIHRFLPYRTPRIPCKPWRLLGQTPRQWGKAELVVVKDVTVTMRAI